MMKRLLLIFVVAFITTQVFAQSVEVNKGQYKNGKELMSTFNNRMLPLKLPQSMVHPSIVNPGNSFKTTSSVVERLDSIVFEHKYYTTWLPEMKMEFAWDNMHQISQFEVKWFDDGSMQYLPAYRTSYQYSPAGELIEELYEYADFYTGVYDPDMRAIYTYELGRLATVKYEGWDYFYSQWVSMDSMAYAYNANGTVSEILYNMFYNSTNQWELVNKRSYSYDAQQQVTEILSSSWDKYSQQFVPFYKEEFMYHPNGKKSEHLRSYFDGHNNQWYPDSRIIYAVDQNGNTTMVTNSYYDEYLSQWFYGSRELRSFDNMNNMVDITNAWFDEVSSLWIDQDKEEYTYDNATTFLDLLLPVQIWGDDVYLAELFNHKITHIFTSEYDPTAFTWVETERGTLYWSSHVIGIEKSHVAADVAIYPNPAENHVYVVAGNIATLMQISVYDMQGRLMLNREVVSGDQVDVSLLNSGMYLYRIIEGNQQLKTGKLIIR